MKGYISRVLALLVGCLCFGLALTSDTHQGKAVGSIFIPYSKPHNEVRVILKESATTLRPEVIETTVAAMECSKDASVFHNHILTVIDYSLPSNQKRLWVFDLKKEKLLYHTYVSHAIKSGEIMTTYFSNVRNSKASSLGVFNTGNDYVGRYGTALKLNGLDGQYNDQAFERFIVMHGAWYVNKKFADKYGRVGRSWGCPAVPRNLIKPITNAIKDGALFVVYYPEKSWVKKSKFLSCKSIKGKDIKIPVDKSKGLNKKEEVRGPILFSDNNGNGKFDVKESVIVIKADDYQKIFKKKPPLKRMIRRQIENKEYIALNQDEYNAIEGKTPKIHYFIVAEVKKKNGYWATEMKVIEDQSKALLKSTERFIRWMGL